MCKATSVSAQHPKDHTTRETSSEGVCVWGGIKLYFSDFTELSCYSFIYFVFLFFNLKIEGGMGRTPHKCPEPTHLTLTKHMQGVCALHENFSCHLLVLSAMSR